MVRFAQVLTLISGFALTSTAYAKPVDVMVQLTNYEGEKAYLVLYLVTPEGRYDRTLWVSGPDTKYHPDLTRWWRYLSRQPQDIDVITGASTGNGDRLVVHLDLEDTVLNTGYAIRVETSVEDQATISEDAEVELVDANNGERVPGTGYVRFVRLKL